MDGTNIAFPPIPSWDALHRSSNAVLKPSVKHTFTKCHPMASSDDKRRDSPYSQRTQRLAGWEKTCHRCTEVLGMHTHSKAMPGYIHSSQCQLLLWLLLLASLLVSRTGGGHFKQATAGVKAQRQSSNSCTEGTASRSAPLSRGAQAGAEEMIWQRPGCLAKTLDLYLESHIIIWWDLHFTRITLTATWKAVKENDQKVTEGHAGKQSVTKVWTQKGEVGVSRETLWVRISRTWWLTCHKREFGYWVGDGTTHWEMKIGRGWTWGSRWGQFEMNKGHPSADVQEAALCMGLEIRHHFELEKTHLQIISIKWMVNETRTPRYPPGTAQGERRESQGKASTDAKEEKILQRTLRESSQG